MKTVTPTNVIVDERLSADRRSVIAVYADGSERAFKRIQGCDPHALAGSVAESDDRVRQLRSDAGEKWTGLQDAQKAIAEYKGDEPITSDHDLFKRLDDAGKAYGEVKDKLADAAKVKDGLLRAMAEQGIGGDGDAGGKTRIPTDERIERILSAGKRLTDSEEYKALQANPVLGSSQKTRLGDHALGKGWDRDEVKALIQSGSDSSAGAFITPDRIGYFPLPMRPLTVLDLITIGDTDSDLVEYVKMLSFTNAAAETPEAISAAPIAPRDGSAVTAVQGGRKPESAMDFTIESTAVKQIAHWVPTTKKSLRDAGQVRTIIDGMLTWGLGDRLERQVVNGNGVGDNLDGLLQTTGMNSIPAGAESHADKVHMAMTQIRLDNFEPTGVILNPLDGETIRLSREDGETGSYLFGAPNNPGPMTLWGLPVALSAAVPQGTGIVGNLRAAVLWMREGAQVIASDSHEDFFTRNLVAILAELAAAFGVPTPQAFCEVDFAAA